MNGRFKRAAAAILAGSLAIQMVSARAETAPPALPFLHASGTAIEDDKGQPVVLRGCNMGNWLLIEPWMLGIYNRSNLRDQSGLEQTLTDRFGAGEKDRILDLYRENWITQRDFDVVKAWNFNLVRLPFHYGLLEDDAKPGELKPDAFRWLDNAVNMARQAGIYVILDMHGAPGGQSLDAPTGKAGVDQFWLPENRKRGAFLWQKIAEHYRDNPTVVAYDLLNEPYGKMNSGNDDAALVGAMDELVHAIRQVDERHIIFCAGSLRGIGMYGSPESRGWKNVGFTEHFYPGVYGGTPTLETHARFIGSNLESRADLLKEWNAPYLAGEFNVVFERAGGAKMMRRYFDVFQSHGWAATLWSYKLLNREGGVHPDHWYMVTNRDPLTPPNFLTDSAGQIEAFCRSLGTMEYAQATDLRDALTAATPPALLLGQYSPVLLPANRQGLPGWKDTDVSDAFPRGGHTVMGDSVQVFGGGRDIYQGNDEFHFVSRAVDGDFSLKADVTAPTDTNPYAKAGIMFRASLAPDSPLVMVNLFPDGRCVLAYREGPGAQIGRQVGLGAGAAALSLARHGTTFEATAYGKNGEEIAAKSIELPNFAPGGCAGLFVLSHDAMQLSAAKFSRVQLETSSPSALNKTR